MHAPSIARRLALAIGVCTLLHLVIGAPPAGAGTYVVASCRADYVRHTADAFTITRNNIGMRVNAQGCHPEKTAEDEGGFITRNITTDELKRRGKVKPTANTRVRKDTTALVVMNTAPDTHISGLEWGGEARSLECGWTLHIYGTDATSNVENTFRRIWWDRRCKRHETNAVDLKRLERPTELVFESKFDDGTQGWPTRIVMSVICEGAGKRKSCGIQHKNRILTRIVRLTIVDNEYPAVRIIPDSDLALGRWVRGDQPLHYDASDNAGVETADAVLGGRSLRSDAWDCARAKLDTGPQPAQFSSAQPCKQNTNVIVVPTGQASEGERPLFVVVRDIAGNVTSSEHVTARIDWTPPARVDIDAQGGEGWRSSNTFDITWTNPPEDDRAPIEAALYKLCPAEGGPCAHGERVSGGISSFDVSVPRPGEWTLAMWRRDEAGNASESLASDPVPLRYDPEAPRVRFDPVAADDPTRVSAEVIDDVSGLARGTIEMSAVGSGTWQTLATQVEGSRLVARIDDAALPAGNYQLRATAFDRADNQGSSSERNDGLPAVVTLPLRIPTTMQIGVVSERIERRVVGRGSKRRTVVRRIRELVRSALIRRGDRVEVHGRLLDPSGRGIPGIELQVLSTATGATEEAVGTLRTVDDGRFVYATSATTSRALRFSFLGSPLILPTYDEVAIRVPAETTLRASRTRLRNGQAVMFSGRVSTLPVAPRGKLIELQALLPGRWQTFRTTRTDASGRWSIPYRFTRVSRNGRIRFRAWLPQEGGYPYEAGASPGLTLKVRGAHGGS